MKRDVPVKSLRKALLVLNRIVFDDPGGRGLALSELARHMALPANSVHNLVKTMAECGYVARNSDGLYVPGPVCRQMGRVNRLAEPLVEAALDRRLRALSDRLGEVCLFAVLAAGERRVIRRAHGTQAVGVNPAVFDGPDDLYTKVTGRVLIAFCTPDERRMVLDRHGMPGTRWDGIRTPTAMERTLAKLRNDGQCAMSPAGPSGNLAAFAVPVFDAGGAFVGALGCYAPLFRCAEEIHPKILAAMRRTAKDLGSDIPAEYVSQRDVKRD